MANSDNKKDTTKLPEEEDITCTKKNNEERTSPKVICRMKTDKNRFIVSTIPKKDSFFNLFFITCIIGISVGIYFINDMKTHQINIENCVQRPKYWVYSNKLDVRNKNGLLKHVHLVLERIGYEETTNKTPWDLLWSHDFPFTVLQNSMLKLNLHQRVNHFPGTGYITNKVLLATTDSRYIPKAFQLPKNKTDFLKYAKKNKDSMFLEKNINHRGVILKNVSEIDVNSGESFVQEYVQKPFLVDGHKFDIGVYVVITSINPLRAYWYKGDVLFRYCPAKYYPFDPKNLDKYVIGDDYMPTWEVPSLAQPHSALGYGMRDAFDNYVRSLGKDPSNMWKEIQKAIAEILIIKEQHIVTATKRYPSQNNFFEMMRFDLIVDEDLKVYLLEANMSPNLSSAHFLPNKLLYEQLLYNLFSLTGISHMSKVNGVNWSDKSAAKEMVSSHKNIGVFARQCQTTCKDDCEALELCKLCRPCLDRSLKNSLFAAHTEYLHRGDFRRLVPPSMSPVEDTEELSSLIPNNLTSTNRLLHLWYQDKCNQDITWCT